MIESQSLLSSSRFRGAKAELLAAVEDASSRIRAIRPANSSSDVREKYLETLKSFVRNRGRDLYFPFLSSGLGSGPYIELQDGRVMLDLITGIGINFFGHSHPALMSELIDAVPSDILQGNLEPGREAAELLEALLSRVGRGSRLSRGWITTCGTMANEIALKIIRQKKAPATRILAFRDCFCGRSTAMQEITDNPGYRQGQPVYGEVDYLPFYDSKLGLDASVRATLGRMGEILGRYPGKFAALMMELVQGEGGFNIAPREFYIRVFEKAKEGGLAIWLDEIQTFGRTGEYFAYQTLRLEEYIDVVTVAKMLQAAAVLFAEEYNPKPGLVAGTFTGSSGALRVGRRILELLSEGGYLGPDGGIARLSRRFSETLARLGETTCRGMIGEIRALGGMIAFTPFDGSMAKTRAVLMKLFDLGVVAFYCGHDPYLVRMLPPLGAMGEADVDLACGLIAQALRAVAADGAVR